MNSRTKRRRTVTNMRCTMPNLVPGQTCQVKYSLYRTCEWYKAVVKSVTDTTVEVTYTGDGSSASLQSDVLCNTKKFRYFEFHENVTGIPETSDEPWQPPGDCIEVTEEHATMIFCLLLVNQTM